MVSSTVEGGTVAVDQAELKQAIELGEEDFFRIWQNGPEVTRWDTLPVQVGNAAPDFALPDHTGTAVSLDGVLASGPAVVLFWRHFACGCGVEHAARLRDELDSYRATGASALIIGPGFVGNRASKNPRAIHQLGHASLVTTDTYLSHIAPKLLIETMAKREWSP